MQNRAVMSRRFRRSGWSSMPKVVVQTASAGDASDVEFPSAARTARVSIGSPSAEDSKQTAVKWPDQWQWSWQITQVRSSVITFC